MAGKSQAGLEKWIFNEKFNKMPCKNKHNYLSLLNYESCEALTCTRDQIMRFVYAISLWVQRKQKHVLCKPKILSTQTMRQRARAAKYCRLQIMFTVWTVYVSSSAAPTISLSSCFLLLTFFRSIDSPRIQKTFLCRITST
jgi:1,2-phenylacetyl-CoA epoxidase PaaB subunit